VVVPRFDTEQGRVPFTPASQIGAVGFGDCQRAGQNIPRAEAGPGCAWPADEIVRGVKIRLATMPGHIRCEEMAEQIRVRAEPDQLAFDFPAVTVGTTEEFLHARVARQPREPPGEATAGRVRQTDEVRMSGGGLGRAVIAGQFARLSRSEGATAGRMSSKVFPDTKIGLGLSGLPFVHGYTCLEGGIVLGEPRIGCERICQRLLNLL